MANEKTYKVRHQQKIDTSEHWALASNFVPLKGEIIIYSDLKKFKVGDGVTTVGLLDFYINESGGGGGGTTTLDIPLQSGFGENSIQFLASQALGNYSMAEGKGTAAHGVGSHAEGTDTPDNDTDSVTQVFSFNDPYDYTENPQEITITVTGPKAYHAGTHAEGSNTLAYGHSAHAEGSGTLAAGGRSHAEGSGTKALSHRAHAEGAYTEASGRSSHAEGESGFARGTASHSEGLSTEANADAAHAEGYDTEAKGYASHAEGYQTLAKGDYSHAEGRKTHAEAVDSHAEGNNTYATAPQSHAEGEGAQATKDRAHAEGAYTVASGYNSHAEGRSTIAAGDNQHAQGRYNVEDKNSKYAHIVGGGESGKSANIHTLDWDGNAWFAGDVRIGGGKDSTGNGYNSASKVATETYVNTKVEDVRIPSIQKGAGEDSLVVGEGVAAGKVSVAGGTTDKDLAAGIIGDSAASLLPNLSPAQAKGDLAISIGAGTVSNSAGSMSIGINSTAGTLGYYIWSISGNKIELATNRKSLTNWTRKKPTSLTWVVGDIVSANNGDSTYGTSYNIKITAVDTSNMTVTVDSLPFDKINTSIVGYMPNDLFIYVPEKPSEGQIQMGFGAYAHGYDCRASGILSTTFGYSNIANGTTAFVTGRENKGGFASLVGGYQNTAQGEVNLVTGKGNLVSGYASSATGQNLVVLGEGAHAEGHATTIFVPDSIDISDVKNIYNDWTKKSATEKYSVAFGNYSHIEGQNTIALGHRAHAEGWMTAAGGWASHAEGKNTYAVDDNSHAEGLGTVAQQKEQHVEGRYNEIDNDNNYAHIVGNGTSSKRENIYTLGWGGNGAYYGNLHAAKDLTVGGKATITDTLYAPEIEANELSVSTKLSVAGNIGAMEHVYADFGDVIAQAGMTPEYGYEFDESISLIKTGMLAENNKARLNRHKGKGSNAEIFNNLFANRADGTDSHAEGQKTFAYGTASHAEGQGPGAKYGDSDHDKTEDVVDYSKAKVLASWEARRAEGKGNVFTMARGDYSHTEGQGTLALGSRSHAEGWSTIAEGSATHAEGNETRAIGSNSHAEGLGTIANSPEQHVQGRYNTIDENGVYAHIIGNGTSSSKRANIHTIDWDGNARFSGNLKHNGAYHLGPYNNFANGYLINIGSSTSNIKVTLRVTGNGYGTLNNPNLPIDSIFQFRNYNENDKQYIVRPSGITLGADIGNLNVYNYNGRLYVHLPKKSSDRVYYFEIMSDKTGLAPKVTDAAADLNGTEIVPVTMATKEDLNALIGDAVMSTESTWSSRNIVDKLCPSFTKSEAIVTCEPVEDYPLEVVSDITPNQSGSGDPSTENIRPISGYTSAILTHHGKNSFGGNVLVDALKRTDLGGGVMVDEANKTVTFDANLMDRSHYPFTRFKENTQYTFIFYGYNTATAGVTNMRVVYTDGSTDYFYFGSVTNPTPVNEAGYARLTTQAGKTVDYLRLSLQSGLVVLYYDQCGIFEGDVSLEEFEPYQDDTFTADPGQTIYGGSLNWNTGELVSNMECITLTGDEDWGIFDDGSGKRDYVFLSIGAYGYVKTSITRICSHFKHVAIASGNDNIGFYVTNSSGYNDARVSFRPKASITLAEWVAFLKEQYANGTPVQVCYGVSAPTEVQFTPQKITAMSGTNTLYSNTGNTKVKGKADPVAIINKLTNAVLSLGGNV